MSMIMSRLMKVPDLQIRCTIVVWTEIPGNQHFIRSPIFNRMEIELDDGQLLIKAPEVSAENIYIQSVSFNVEILSIPWFFRDDIRSGGITHFKVKPDLSDFENDARVKIAELTFFQCDTCLKY